MADIIKGNKPGANIIVDGDVKIDNHISVKIPPKEQEQEQEQEKEGEQEEYAPVSHVDIKELEALREHYRKEGEDYAQALKEKAEQQLAGAADEADRIIAEAKLEVKKQREQLEQEKQAVLEQAKTEGYDNGYSEGMQKGNADGYAQGLEKCSEALRDLKDICSSIEKEKARLMAESRRGIFDLAMTVAEKVTVTTFKQKDKKALESMISDAAKEFRRAKAVRVTLSRLDLSEDTDADLQILEKCFSPTTQVEFEILDDAESGTILLDSGSEILDAGVSAQLKMIGELGRGKFRDDNSGDGDKSDNG